MSKLQIDSLTDNIVHISLPSEKELAQALIRFQEHYESPFEDIKGKVFTLGYLRSKGRRDDPGIFTYEGGHHYDADWSGYNFPSYVLEPFIRGMFDPLTSYEQDIVSALKNKQGKFYVIGTSEDYSKALDHEIAHALYYVDQKYREAVDKVLDRVDLTELRRIMTDMGYCDEVLDDECHAYLSADYDWIIERHKITTIPRSIHTALKRLRLKHYEG